MNNVKLFCQPCQRALIILTVLAFLAVQVSVLARPSTPKPLAVSRLASDLKVQAEIQALSQFARALEDYGVVLKRVRSNPRPKPDDVKALQDAASRLKAEMPNAAQNTREFVRKLREDGQLKDEQKFNQFALDKIDTMNIDPRAKEKIHQILREKGGAKALLEAGPSTITQLSAEIDADLRASATAGSPTKVALSIPTARTPVIFSIFTLKCQVGVLLTATGGVACGFGVVVGCPVAGAGVKTIIDHCLS